MKITVANGLAIYRLFVCRGSVEAEAKIEGAPVMRMEKVAMVVVVAITAGFVWIATFVLL